MPTYIIYDTKKNKTFDVFCSWNVLQDKLKDNPHWEKCITAPAIVSDHITARTDGGMKEVFSKISEKHPNSALADRFGSGRGGKSRKVENVGKKHGLIRKDGSQNVCKLGSKVTNYK